MDRSFLTVVGLGLYAYYFCVVAVISPLPAGSASEHLVTIL
ncbi:MAG: hypothetical protein ACFB16_12820 [Phormidesmis sp.]